MGESPIKKIPDSQVVPRVQVYGGALRNSALLSGGAPLSKRLGCAAGAADGDELVIRFEDLLLGQAHLKQHYSELTRSWTGREFPRISERFGD